ncbi:hypothetical protein CMO95_00640 [Candidatus Woesearchaeota archaeon]|nr:hypothetical protein [Candidatus Woesearchaeota archaeon]|tara:strand:+ start:515 stop:718 length:204 start_codon:yes stop_codon:yes gene_type:complete
MKNSDIDKLIEYVNSLEIAYGLIEKRDNVIGLDENTIKKLNDVSGELGFIIEDIDKEYRKEFYDEIE